MGKTMSPVAALRQISPKGAYPFGQLGDGALSRAAAALAYASIDIPIVIPRMDRIASPKLRTASMTPARFDARPRQFLIIGKAEPADGTVCV
jgi:hypothetical protein